MKLFGEAVLTFLLFGSLVYFALPLLTRRPMSRDTRLTKALWASFMFTMINTILNILSP